ncbi:MAG TPA: hypothetical protein ENK91_01315, partial [Bacteroidetes bacterium]|nr:hypothetical protein [Bacteroidota bacterium]
MKNVIIILIVVTGIISSYSQGLPFRNPQLQEILTPFQIPFPKSSDSIKYDDLDNDGDPDVLKYVANNGVSVLWIDDDDDMLFDDIQGDMDNDCLMFDLNNDGKYGSEKDLIVDRIDVDSDSKADWQLIIDNNNKDNKGKWTSHYIWFEDLDKDGIFGYIDWNTMKFEGWDHSGRANFFTDYNGKSLMLKVHITTDR